MTPAFAYPERVPADAVERLLQNFADLVQAVQDALASTTESGMEASRLVKARDLLATESSSVESAAEAFLKGRCDDLLRQAWQLRQLARRMDGYSCASMDEKSAQAIIAKRQLLVLTAWQITAAASGSEAAGL